MRSLASAFYNRSVKRFFVRRATLIAARAAFSMVFFAAVLAAQPQEGNYKIRFEPTAKLQTGTRVPFEVTVTDDRQQPLTDAKVVLTCTEVEGSAEFDAEAFATTPGIYVAKPVFPKTGTWSIRALVTRNDKRSSRVIQFTVAE